MESSIKSDIGATISESQTHNLDSEGSPTGVNGGNFSRQGA